MKQVIYFSMEFLIGRLLVNNMQNLGIYQVAKEGLADFNINIHDLEEKENDAGLGNGGLGRLAACFMDSIASCGYPGHGYTIRYEYGFFRQKIENGKQIEVPDQWLTLGNVWEIRKPKHAVEVSFYGHIEWRQGENGRSYCHLVNAEHIRCVPYDMPVIGYENKITNTLRLWSAEPSSENLPRNKDFHSYLSETRELCHGLYPDDSTEKGKMLRLKQQYLLVSASLQSVLKSYLKENRNFDNLSSRYVFHLNDTHPILAIPELMRILIDEFYYEWDKAWEITTSVFAYTNHTVMAEALEKWPVSYIRTLLPRIYLIIEEINRRFEILVRNSTGQEEKVRSMAIIKDSMVHMTNLAIATCFSVNGVAALHTEILKNEIFSDFYQLMPEKFNNKTNGITHRRWLVFANPELRKLLADCIGEDYICNPNQLTKILENVNNKKMLRGFLDVKKQRKKILADYIYEHNHIKLDVDSIFDIQVKRLHSYKRQLLNIFHVIYLYQRLRADANFKIHPRTFIFGAKAAPSYFFAKKVIELILSVGETINNDPYVSQFIKVVFIENYDVSKAEIIMPAADISEQISTAGKEASGTGNMKFMLNGAITLGTLDGANVEIYNLVGDDNMILFGLKNQEINELRKNHSYNVWNVYNQDNEIKQVIDSLKDGTFGDSNKFNEIYNEIMYKNDEYFVLADFRDYCKAQQKAEEWYKEREQWAKKCLINIGNSGFFSSDRTIGDYAKEIWHLKQISDK
ncbi:glycogen phosphorylase [Holotrichia oblita]|nr:glycogen phosphorylase [Holotrichia oblita]